jgi:hypothetical protein
MSQPADGATDLGQPLPTGLLERVQCPSSKQASAAATKNAKLTDCSVRWRTESGKPRLTRYRVRMFDDGCFDAAAQPSLPPHLDPTVEGYSEHPLNILVGTEEGCS